MTKPLANWNEVFHDAWKWPQHRVIGYDVYKNKNAHHLEQHFKKFLFQLGRPGYWLHSLKLSADVVWAVSKLSQELPLDYLTAQAKSCRFPFLTMVVEWNPNVREQAYADMRVRQDNRVPAMPGETPAFVISQDEEGETSVFQISYTPVEKIMAWFPLMFKLNKPMNSDQTFKCLLRQLKIPDNIYAEYLFTTDLVKKEPESLKVYDDPNVGVFMTGPLALKASRLPAKEWVDTLMSQTAGQFRWFGALCTLLNRQAMTRYVDIDLPESVPGEAKKPRESDAVDRQLVLLLPREKVVKRCVQTAERERKQVGLHEVGGHWAYSHHKGNDACQHQWPTQPSRRQVCELCGKLRWWKEAHERGEGEMLKVRRRRADMSGVSVDRLVETIKQEVKEAKHGHDN